MRRWMVVALAAVLLLGLAPAWAPAWASEQPRVAVRGGDHPGFGRMVFDWPAAPAYRVEQDGDRHLVRFPRGALALDGLRRLPRNIRAVRAVEGGVELTLAPGARLRHFRNGPKVAFDALDAAAGAPVPAATAPPPAARAATPAAAPDRKSTRLNSSHSTLSRMPSSA